MATPASGPTRENARLESEEEDLTIDLVPNHSFQEELGKTATLGMFLGKWQVNKASLKPILGNLWASFAGWRIEELKKEVFLFRFKKQEHCRQDLLRRPWNFAGGHLILKEWPEGGYWEGEKFSNTLLWVQAHGLPVPFLSEENTRRVAKRVGLLKELHQEKKLLSLRFQAEISTSNPLPVGFFQPRGDGEELWIQLNFENLPLFCYVCGFIGHVRQVVISQAGRKAWKFRPWLKAETGRESCFQVASLLTEKTIEDTTQALKNCALDKRVSYIKSTCKASDPTFEHHEVPNGGPFTAIIQGSSLATVPANEEMPKILLPSNTISGPPGQDVVYEKGTVARIQLDTPKFSLPATLLLCSDKVVRTLSPKDGPFSDLQEALSHVAKDHANLAQDEEPFPLITGLNILQEVECLHNLICKSRVPHFLLEIQPIAWPDKEIVPNLSWELANLGPGSGYLAQQSLLYNPVEIPDVIAQALGSKKRKVQQLLSFTAEKATPSSEIKSNAKAARIVPFSITKPSEEALLPIQGHQPTAQRCNSSRGSGSWRTGKKSLQRIEFVPEKPSESATFSTHERGSWDFPKAEEVGLYMPPPSS